MCGVFMYMVMSHRMIMCRVIMCEVIVCVVMSYRIIMCRVIMSGLSELISVI